MTIRIETHENLRLFLCDHANAICHGYQYLLRTRYGCDAHTGFRTRAECVRWLEDRGLYLKTDGITHTHPPEYDRVTTIEIEVIGSYRTAVHLGSPIGEGPHAYRYDAGDNWRELGDAWKTKEPLRIAPVGGEPSWEPCAGWPAVLDRGWAGHGSRVALRTRTLVNGSYQEARITLDVDGIRTVHTLNPNVLAVADDPQRGERETFGYFESRALENAGEDMGPEVEAFNLALHAWLASAAWSRHDWMNGLVPERDMRLADIEVGRGWLLDDRGWPTYKSSREHYEREALLDSIRAELGDGLTVTDTRAR